MIYQRLWWYIRDFIHCWRQQTTPWACPMNDSHCHDVATSDTGVFHAVVMTSSNGKVFRVTGQWRGALMFSLICAWINGWVNNREAGDLRRHRAHYDVTVMYGHIINNIHMSEIHRFSCNFVWFGYVCGKYSLLGDFFPQEVYWRFVHIIWISARIWHVWYNWTTVTVCYVANAKRFCMLYWHVCIVGG